MTSGRQEDIFKHGLSVREQRKSGSSLDNMLKAASAVQQMTELNVAVSEEDKVLATTKIVLKLISNIGH